MRDLRDSEGYKENIEGHEVVARDALTTLQEEPRDYPIATQWWSWSRMHTPHCGQWAALGGR